MGDGEVVIAVHHHSGEIQIAMARADLAIGAEGLAACPIVPIVHIAQIGIVQRLLRAKRSVFADQSFCLFQSEKLGAITISSEIKSPGVILVLAPGSQILMGAMERGSRISL